ncbi:Hypothetical predicted protein [Mytilus galloprovincialis]|uniref:THAP-type domain-containing protein n=1 Tax=Mytilus galloprovincialis TaxID=29158 RepID=A0A8B6HKK5_MYTGA|nr:Hypothetical predicted protein [Mytilus galloprovincialis]
MSTCQVFGCFGYYYKGASLYKFPDPLKQKELYQTWLRILNLQDDSFTPSRHKGVCSDHFETSSYELNFMTKLIGHTPRPRLKPDAVPTIFAVDQSTRVDIRYEARKRDLELIEFMDTARGVIPNISYGHSYETASSTKLKLTGF